MANLPIIWRPATTVISVTRPHRRVGHLSRPTPWIIVKSLVFVPAVIMVSPRAEKVLATSVPQRNVAFVITPVAGRQAPARQTIALSPGDVLIATMALTPVENQPII